MSGSKEVVQQQAVAVPPPLAHARSFTAADAEVPTASDADLLFHEHLLPCVSIKLRGHNRGGGGIAKSAQKRAVKPRAVKRAMPAPAKPRAMPAPAAKPRAVPSPAAAAGPSPAALFSRADYAVALTEPNGDCGYTAVVQAMVRGRIQPQKGQDVWARLLRVPDEQRGAALRRALKELLEDGTRGMALGFGMDERAIERTRLRVQRGLSSPRDPQGYAESEELRMLARTFGVALGVYNESSLEPARQAGRPLVMWELIDGTSDCEHDVLDEGNVEAAAARCEGRFVPLVARAQFFHFDALFRKARGGVRHAAGDVVY